jgi:diadenosine tetraphosphate (Ap4A) HIT family hydrolase
VLAPLPEPTAFVSQRCPFCQILQCDAAGLRFPGAAAFPDVFPVSPGHTVVVPNRHVSGFFDLAADEQAAVWALVAEVPPRLAAEHAPDGFDVGVNAGEAAGQTLPHAHVHVIARYAGGVPDLWGGAPVACL